MQKIKYPQKHYIIHLCTLTTNTATKTYHFNHHMRCDLESRDRKNQKTFLWSHFFSPMTFTILFHNAFQEKTVLNKNGYFIHYIIFNCIVTMAVFLLPSISMDNTGCYIYVKRIKLEKTEKYAFNP